MIFDPSDGGQRLVQSSRKNGLFVLRDNHTKFGFKLISMKRETQKYEKIQDRTIGLDFRAI